LVLGTGFNLPEFKRRAQKNKRYGKTVERVTTQNDFGTGESASGPALLYAVSCRMRLFSS
jgi:hypothetical protein